MAECVSQRLGYRCVGREVIVEKAAASGVSQQELEDALLKPPSFLDRFRQKKYQYLTLIQAALAEEVREGKTVYHGNAGHLLLKGDNPILRVRIIAPLEFRIRMAEDRLKISRGEAISYIKRVDHNRQKWTHYLYGVNWGDPALYDIVINMEYIDVSEAGEVITGIVKRQRCFKFGPECARAAEDFALACRVKAALVLDPATSSFEFEVTATEGDVTIRGRLSQPQDTIEVRRVAEKVPGVVNLDLDQLVSRIEA